MLIAIIIIDLLCAHYKYVLWITVKDIAVAKDKKHKDRTETEKSAMSFLLVNTMWFFMAMPYLLYQLFVNPSVPVVVALVTQVIYNTAGSKVIKAICDVIYIACLFWIWFIIYS